MNREDKLRLVAKGAADEQRSDNDCTRMQARLWLHETEDMNERVTCKKVGMAISHFIRSKKREVAENE